MWEKKLITLMLCFCLLLMSNIALADKKEEKRQDVRNLKDRILANLFSTYPSARGTIKEATAYAVFGTTGTKFGLFSSAHGRGMAIDNTNGKEYFMKMMEAGIGLGIGISETSVIFVFESKKAFNDFITEGWNFGGQANVSASDNVSGGTLVEGAVSVAPDVWVYQIVGKGIAATLTLNGTKYYIDDDLK